MSMVHIFFKLVLRIKAWAVVVAAPPMTHCVASGFESHFYYLKHKILNLG